MVKFVLKVTNQHHATNNGVIAPVIPGAVTPNHYRTRNINVQLIILHNIIFIAYFNVMLQLLNTSRYCHVTYLAKYIHMEHA